MNILLTNDDGIKAKGICALRDALAKKHTLIVAAPASEKSAMSHAISLGKKMRVEDQMIGGIRHIGVFGTPADSVKFALSGVTGVTPDLIISGINQGANTGVSVYYSGTISAAREGLINRIPSVAVSLASKTYDDFAAAVCVIEKIVDGYSSGAFPKDVLLNVNVPPLKRELIKGFKVTKQAESRFVEEFIVEVEPSGEKIYKLAGKIELYDSDGTTDEEAVLEGYVSITPFKLDVTYHERMPELADWFRKIK